MGVVVKAWVHTYHKLSARLFFYFCVGVAFTKAEVIRLGGVEALHASCEAYRNNSVVHQSLENALRIIRSS